jgi:hypothetical protein
MSPRHVLGRLVVVAVISLVVSAVTGALFAALR